MCHQDSEGQAQEADFYLEAFSPLWRITLGFKTVFLQLVWED